jgi:hypothetical protein
MAFNRIRAALLGLVGAVLGGIAGYYIYWWILGQGFNALVLPGAMIGFGCGVFSLHRSQLLGVACGLAALAFGLYCEWSHAPFVQDESLKFFLAHFYWLVPIKLILIALGGLTAYWLGQTSALEYWRERRPERARQPPSDEKP